MIKFPEGRKAWLINYGKDIPKTLALYSVKRLMEYSTEGVFLTTAEYEQIKQAVADERGKVLEEAAIMAEHQICCYFDGLEEEKKAKGMPLCCDLADAIRAMKQPNHTAEIHYEAAQLDKRGK